MVGDLGRVGVSQLASWVFLTCWGLLGHNVPAADRPDPTRPETDRVGDPTLLLSLITQLVGLISGAS